MGSWDNYVADLQREGVAAMGFAWDSLEDEHRMFDALRVGAECGHWLSSLSEVLLPCILPFAQIVDVYVPVRGSPPATAALNTSLHQMPWAAGHQARYLHKGRPPAVQNGLVRALVLDGSFLDYTSASECDMMVVGEQFAMVRPSAALPGSSIFLEVPPSH